LINGWQTNGCHYLTKKKINEIETRKTRRGGQLRRQKQKPMSFDDLLKDLQGQKAVQEDPNYVSLDELFNKSFLNKYSKYDDIRVLMEKGNFQVETQKDIDNIPEELLDVFVARETDFPSWKSMLDAASREYAENNRSST
jgi:hypothetical protein